MDTAIMKIFNRYLMFDLPLLFYLFFRRSPYGTELEQSNLNSLHKRQSNINIYKKIFSVKDYCSHCTLAVVD